MVAAAMATWAAPIQNRTYFIGDTTYFAQPAHGIMPSSCAVDRKGVACKLAPLLIEAFERKASWVVVFQTDHYMLPLRWEQLLLSKILESW